MTAKCKGKVTSMLERFEGLSTGRKYLVVLTAGVLGGTVLGLMVGAIRIMYSIRTDQFID